MNRWQRAVGLSKPARERRQFDPMAGLFMGSAAPVNGRFEVSTADLASVSQQITKRSGQIYALMEWRRRAFSDVRFQWQNLQNGVPGDFFGNRDLGVLEVPWPNGTTKSLLNRMIQDADHLGNAYITPHPKHPDQLRRLRPDWVFTVWGSDGDEELFGDALDAELLGYVYAPRTRGMYEPEAGEILLPEDVAHFAPTPDPEAHGMGMSWLTPILREISTDMDLVRHKQLFFRNGASPRMVVKVDESIEEEEFARVKAIIDKATLGDGQYSTLYLAGGADPVPMTTDLRKADFSKISGAAEVRLANAAGVPAPVAGLAAALQGSSLNAGNLKAETSLFIDLTVRDLWAAAAGALESILTVPGGSRLWYDTRDTALAQDAEAAAGIRTQDATTAASLFQAGFEPESIVAYIASNNPKLLKHTGKSSVQTQGSSTDTTPPPVPGADTTKTSPGEIVPTEGE